MSCDMPNEAHIESTICWIDDIVTRLLHVNDAELLKLSVISEN